MQYRTLTAEQLAKLPPKLKCRMMKEIIEDNMRFIPEGQVTANETHNSRNENGRP